MVSLDEIDVLLIEDSRAEARLLQEMLAAQQAPKSRPFHLLHVTRLETALERIRQNAFDVVLLDLSLPDSQGLATLKTLINRAPTLPVVVLTNTNDDELALEAVRQGAQDYLVKRQVSTSVLVRSLCYAIERKQVAEALRTLNQALEIRVQERTAELLKAKELNQFQTEFVSMLSHDFRNPLNAILLSTGLLQTGESRLSSEKKLTHFQLIRSAINDMAQLLDEVLLIGQADAGKLQCHRVPLDLQEFCRKLIVDLQERAGEQYQITFNFQEDVGRGAWDENLLRHILWNLLANAIKYSPEGGAIRLDLRAAGTSVVFQVHDQGIGIPLQDQEQLFQPFHRGRNTGAIAGTGLGLAIVKRCVETYGGEIAVTSQVGKGTVVSVTLPVQT